MARLLLGEFVSSLGDAIYLVAFVVVVFRETHDPVLLGVIAAARMAPFVLLSIPAGIIVDRFDRRLVLLASDVAKAACMLGLAWIVATGGGVWGIAALAVLSAVMSTVFWPALWALIPNLVDDERDYGPANSAWATLDNIAWVVGPAIAGVLLVSADDAWPFLINAITFALMAAILWTIPSRVRAAADGVRDPHPAGTAAEATPTTGSGASPAGPTAGPMNVRAMSGIIVIGVVAAFAIAGINILTVVLVVDVFRASDDATGYLNSAVGLGGTIGAVLAGILVLRPRAGPVIVVASAAMGAAVLALGVAPTVAIAFVAITGASIANLVLEVLRTTILQRLVPDAYRGRFTGTLMTAVMLAEITGTLVVPILVAAAGVGWVLAGTGSLVALGGIVAAGLLAGSGDARTATAEMEAPPHTIDPLHT